MSTQIDSIIRLRRGPDAERQAITLSSGEISYSTDIKRVYIGDGTTVGGSLVGNQTFVTATPSYSAVPNDLMYNPTTGIFYVLTAAGGDNINNYARITPNVDSSLSFSNGRIGVNSTFFSNSATGFLSLTGGQMTGYILLSGTPILDLHAISKGFLETRIAELTSASSTSYSSFVRLSGGLMTGRLSSVGDPVTSTEFSNKRYVDAGLSAFGSNGYGNRTVSTIAPTGGSNGDIWLQI